MSVREPRKETCEKNDVANIQGLNEIQGLEKTETLNFKTLKEKNTEKKAAEESVGIPAREIHLLARYIWNDRSREPLRPLVCREYKYGWWSQ